MKSEKRRTRLHTLSIAHLWQGAYAAALSESDPDKLIGRIEYAISTIERRYLQWASDPGTPAELMAIQKCIAALQRLMKEEQVRRHGPLLSKGSTGRSDARSLRPAFEHLKQLTDSVGTPFP